MIDSEYFCHYVGNMTTTMRNHFVFFPREVLKGWFGCVCVCLCVLGLGGGEGGLVGDLGSGGWGGNAKAFKS